MRIALLAERFRSGVECAEHAVQIAWRRSQFQPFCGERGGIWPLSWAKAAITTAIERGTDRTATGMGDRTETRCSLHHDAGVAAQLALDADGMIADLRLSAG